MLAIPFVVRLTHGGEALPGTTVAGIDVAGMDAAALRARLRPLANPRRAVVVLAGEERLTVRPADAGYRLDLDATVQRALDAGRDGALGGLPATVAGLLSERDVALDADVDRVALRRTVETLARRVDEPSFPGALKISDDGLDVTAEPPRAGRLLDREQLRARLRRALLERSSGPLRVAVRATPVVSAEEVDAIATEAGDYLASPLTLLGAGAPFQVGRAELARALVLEPLDDGSEVRLGVDDEAVAAIVARFAHARDRPPRDARVSAGAGGVVVDGKEDLTWRPRAADVSIVPARAGRAVQQKRLATAIARAVRDGSHNARVPTRRVAPEVTTREARSADRLIGTFTTYYEPGQPRVTNIQTMARAVDGTVIAPGGQFSLNGIVGERTRAKGYLPAPFIADGRLVPSVGGGVSQFATTTYNAAYFAGLQLDTSQPHSLFIDRYPAGREATLNHPDIDLAWTNDTDAPVLVRAAAGDTSVTVSLYGDNGGRVVSAVTGARRPVPGGDFSIEVTRVVRRPGGDTERTPRTTTYDLLDE
ncbi:VanW family protein [Conexibacter stalactiti]|uniref:VanW family protein n=1 Tax=Conexibacter stalactiti TaxID=1940611 RepID=A0ABU4HP49_9ACTN|nr:VanW family protein [Conexibacter stalactiti]MDW5593824.1 VanW family protein [Conexibacter stalactiti]MEC5034466.1 VanW family protein [Conexibacter stalactiti]